MPRGYLKHRAKSAGEKKARGGSSRKATTGRKRTQATTRQNNINCSEYLCYDIYEDFADDGSYDDVFAGRTPSPVAVGDNGLHCATIAEYIFKGAHKEHENAIIENAIIEKTDTESFVSVGLASLSDDNDDYSLCSGVSQIGTDDSFSVVGLEDGDDGASLISMDTEAKNDVVVIQAPCEGNAESTHEKSSTNDRYLQVVKCREDDTFQCAICLENKSLTERLRLFQKCKHAMACRDCLHTCYIKNAAETNLKCYWPGCDRRLGHVQANLLTKKESELYIFHARQARQKADRKEKERLRREAGKYALLQERRIWNFKTLQYCRECTAATPVYPTRCTTFECRGCKMQSNIDVMAPGDVKAIVHADAGPIAIVQADAGSMASSSRMRTLGDFLVNCPSCFTLIVKDGGCDHMHCALCDTEFDFSAAKVRFDH